MTTLNAGARDAAVALGAAVHAATDVTGFGLLGHLGEMLAASGVGATVSARRGAGDRRRARARRRRLRRRRHAAQPRLRLRARRLGRAPRAEQLLLADAQTSGGLLFAVAPDHADALVAELTEHRTPAAAVVGHVETAFPGAIRIR